MKIWLPDPVYKLKPILFLFAAVILFLLMENKIVLVLAALLICWSTYILLMRYMWLDSGGLRK